MVLIDPWGSVLVKDYEDVVKTFGLETFNPKLFPEPNRLMRRGVVFAGRDLRIIAGAIKKKEKFYALTGIMPSAEKIHFGNKMVVEMMNYFQEHGAKTYVLVADLEAAATRGVSLEQARKTALDFHLPAWIALGLDPKKTTFYMQSENKEVVHMAYNFSKKITLNEFRSIYGSADPGRIMGALTQSGDILYPQLKERMPGVIPVGIDQDPHIRLTRDIVERTKSSYNFIPPSAVFNKFTPSLDGELKMSKSKPASCIELPENAKEVCRKLKGALTGGRDTVDEQKKLGGEPEKCMIFELYKQHLIDDDKQLQKIYDDCKSGKLLCGEDKQHACELMTKFMEKFEKDMERARKKVRELKFVEFK
jgi:tryptophanyl-tRNA synthetase